MITSSILLGLPRCLSDKESTCQCRRHGFDPWVVNIPWRRTKQQQHTTDFSYINVFCCVVVQSLSCAWLFATPWTAAHLSFTVSWNLLRFMSTESVMLSNHLFLCHSFLLLPSIFPSIRVFYNELFTLDSQSIAAPTSATVLLMNIQSWFPLLLTGGGNGNPLQYSCLENSMDSRKGKKIFSGAISNCLLLFSYSTLDIFWPGRLIFQCHSFLLFILSMRFSRQDTGVGCHFLL